MLLLIGGVPLLKDEISSLDEVKYVKRSSRKELADFIIEEAGDAAKILDKDRRRYPGKKRGCIDVESEGTNVARRMGKCSKNL